MNFQQLRIVREAVKQGFNLTEVGRHLHTTQSAVSKNILELEDELGVDLFVRRGKRLTGLTPAGEELTTVVDRILLDSQNLRRIAGQHSRPDAGHLRIATTHTQARYALPNAIRAFRAKWPNVHLELHQGSPREILDLLRSGSVDIGVATEALATDPELVVFAWYDWQHALVVPQGHPLEQVAEITLEVLADYPIITYHEGFTGRAQIDAAFELAGLAPEIVLTALDADVIKTYVELGLGVGLIADVAFNAERDQGLRLLPTPGLFHVNTTRIAVRRGHYLRDYALQFIEQLIPSSSAQDIIDKVRPVAGW